MTEKQNFHDDEEAVSPVIGVILMVAITVILAAVIGTFVLDLGSSVSTNVQAGVSIDDDPGNNEISATFTENQNANHTVVRAVNSSGVAVGEYGMGSIGDRVTFGNASTSSNVTTQGDVWEISPYPAQGHFEDDTIDITVKAVDGDQETVLNSQSYDLS